MASLFRRPDDQSLLSYYSSRMGFPVYSWASLEIPVNCLPLPSHAYPSPDLYLQALTGLKEWLLGGYTTCLLQIRNPRPASCRVHSLSLTFLVAIILSVPTLPFRSLFKKIATYSNNFNMIGQRVLSGIH